MRAEYPVLDSKGLVLIGKEKVFIYSGMFKSHYFKSILISII